jgi:hypothetical protein
MNPISFTPEPIVAEQLETLSQITQRPPATLINELIAGTLSQAIESRDADMVSHFMGSPYPSREKAEAAAANYNALVRTARLLHTPKANVAQDETEFCIEFVSQAAT